VAVRRQMVKEILDLKLIIWYAVSLYSGRSVPTFLKRLLVSIFMLDKILEINVADSSETSVLDYFTNGVSCRKTVVFEVTYVRNSTLKF
jgi:hypothetical protein